MTHDSRFETYSDPEGVARKEEITRMLIPNEQSKYRAALRAILRRFLDDAEGGLTNVLAFWPCLFRLLFFASMCVFVSHTA